MAWLMSAHDFFHDRPGHQLLGRVAKAGDDRVALVERQACRMWAQANIPGVLECERPRAVDGGEPQEPIEVAH